MSADSPPSLWKGEGRDKGTKQDALTCTMGYTCLMGCNNKNKAFCTPWSGLVHSSTHDRSLDRTATSNRSRSCKVAPSSGCFRDGTRQAPGIVNCIRSKFETFPLACASASALTRAIVQEHHMHCRTWVRPCTRPHDLSEPAHLGLEGRCLVRPPPRHVSQLCGSGSWRQGHNPPSPLGDRLGFGRRGRHSSCFEIAHLAASRRTSPSLASERESRSETGRRG